MKISVVIPTFNSAAVIGPTIESVLCQTRAPDEILVLDDGSTDETLSILHSYKAKVSVLQQQNCGVANARNVLCRQASGDIVAFLDHDDLWHPRYLEVQSRSCQAHPEGVAFFTGHVDFHGYGQFEWEKVLPAGEAGTEVLNGLDFFKTYNQAPGRFGSMSFLCIPKQVLKRIGEKPFCELVSGADDFHLCNVFPLLGPAVYTATPLVAYRITREAQSANQLRNYQRAVTALELLEERYRKSADADLFEAFKRALATKRRRYAKTLLDAGRASEARLQCRSSMRSTNQPASLAKSYALWLASYLPIRWSSESR